jgi:phosphoribosylformylglycinamidine synthase subunit PurQ / glutaminase
MAKPGVLILTGYGINCDEETKYAFEKAGGNAKIIHINDIIKEPKILNNYQIFAFAGGFSYGDDTGSGNALANRIKNNLNDEFLAFMQKDILILGICNGFQVMVNLGIVPGFSEFGIANASLEHNVTNRYECRWVNLKANTNSKCVFTKDLTTLRVPVGHGEGSFYAPQDILDKLKTNNQIVFQYANSDGSLAREEFPANPNGAIIDIAAISDKTGRFMGMMPHPDRNFLFTQRDDWTKEKERLLRNGEELPEESQGIQIFRNAVNYFS